ncbi:Protein kinase superfamily protein [Rhynchospora pubera]|uniref:Protein kinase superfamily protein n=2 Tax=Rhynchospora pubera TaxID=906938 RepID=A0AAV8EBA5_9POAL|nr:Protein kinase superfamily protein [Rhynchospora pubera]KAJ4802443.1 Protein kinase superfamily protein [Rhynchospora pubera]
MAAKAAVLPVSAILSPKKQKQVKHVEKLETMWSSSDGSKGKETKRVVFKEASSGLRGGGSEVLRVIRSDVEFISKATAPIRKAVGDFLWFPFLEKKPESSVLKQGDDLATAQPPESVSVLKQGDDFVTSRLPEPVSSPNQDDGFVTARPQQEFPVLSPYSQGLSCVELMMADFEALKLYANYFWQSSKVVSTPVPETYDPQIVADYFLCRPHILGYRIIEILFAFLTASVKLRASNTTMVEPDVHIAKRSIRFDSSKYYMGQLLKETLLYLGPTFIKVGQSLSTRPDIIGSEICEALSDLHDKVPPFPRETAMKIIQSELGCPLDKKFSFISDQPVAAASFGQVYKGCMTDGKIVAIKVQRPDVLRSVVRDMYILRLGLGLVRRVAKRRNDIALYADELGKGFVGELDYTLEASNASIFLEAHSQYSFMVVPKVFKELTTKRVLTMEWLVGENPTKLLSVTKELPTNSTSSMITNADYLGEKLQVEAKDHLLDLVNKGVRASLVQLLETGLLHADPHPGNLRYTPDGRIGFLDFGLLCKMEKKHQVAMLASIVHIANADWAGLISDLTHMDMVPPGTNLRRVTLELEDALGEVAFDEGIPDVKFSKVLANVWSVALKHHFRMPPYYTLVLRSLASLEGLAVAVDENFKTFQAAYPFVVRKLLYDNSLATRKILYSVVLNRRRELQLKKVLLFLRLGSTRKSIGVADWSERTNRREIGDAGEFQTAKLILNLLPSRDGVVLRRLLMTADGASLAGAMLCKETVFFRQFLVSVFADSICQWLMKTTIGKEGTRQLTRETTSQVQAIITDRRVRVVLFKVVRDVSRQPFLALRSACCLLKIFVVALARALHRFVVQLSEGYLPSFSMAPRQIVGTT